jgi:hypothetical protein
MKRKPLRPIQVVFVQRKGEPEGVYASRPVELFFVDWTVDEGDPSHGAVYAGFESGPMREVPAEAVRIFCTRAGEHAHRGDACPLELPSGDEDEEDEADKEEPGLPSMADVLRRQRQAFIERFGREPREGDPIFFDPSAAQPQPMNLEVAEQKTLEAMHKAKIHPALIHAFQKTGRLLGKEGAKRLSPAELQEWQDAIDEWYASHPGEPRPTGDSLFTEP